MRMSDDSKSMIDVKTMREKIKGYRACDVYE